MKNEITKDTKENKDSKTKSEKTDKSAINDTQVKLGVFEEDDYFEEFDDEEWNESHNKEDVDFKRWQEDWEDEEINDQFEKVLKKEMDAFKVQTK